MSRIVRCQYDLVALPYSLLCHEWPFALVPVSAASADGYHLSLSVEHFVYGVQHVLYCVRCVCIVNDSRHALGRAYRLQSSGYALQHREDEEHLILSLAEHACRAVDSEEIRDIELSDELHSDLTVVNLEQHALEVAFYDACLIVGHGPCAVCADSGAGVLHHDHSVLVVGVGDGECSLGEIVEEQFLGVAVVLECLVIVKMVTCEIGEYAAREDQSAYALLVYGMA